MYYKCNKTHFKRGGSYIESPDKIEKKATKNSKNEDNKSFQDATAITLNHEKIKSPREIQKLSLLC